MTESVGWLRASIDKEDWGSAKWHGRSAFNSFDALVLDDCITDEDRKVLAEHFPKLKLAIDRKDKEGAEEEARKIGHRLRGAVMRMFKEKLCEV